MWKLAGHPARGFTVGIEQAALDPFRGYANAIHAGLPAAVAVVDAGDGTASMRFVRALDSVHVRATHGRSRWRPVALSVAGFTLSSVPPARSLGRAAPARGGPYADQRHNGIRLHGRSKQREGKLGT